MKISSLVLTNETLTRKITKMFLDFAPWKSPKFTAIAGILKKNSHRLIWLWVWSQKVNESFELKILKDSLKPGMTVLDIGANIGVQTFIASKIVGRTGRVFAFEPDPFIAEILEKRVREHALKNVKVEQLALSNRVGFSKLYIDSVNPGNNSLSKKNLYAGEESVMVPSVKLDTFLKREKIKKVDVVNLDAQGAEALIFEGAKDFLKKTHAKIFMEFWPKGILSVGGDPKALLRKLKECGYNFWILDKKKKRVVPATYEELVSETDRWEHYTDYTNLLLSK